MRRTREPRRILPVSSTYPHRRFICATHCGQFTYANLPPQPPRKPAQAPAKQSLIAVWPRNHPPPGPGSLTTRSRARPPAAILNRFELDTLAKGKPVGWGRGAHGRFCLSRPHPLHPAAHMRPPCQEQTSRMSQISSGHSLVVVSGRFLAASKAVRRVRSSETDSRQPTPEGRVGVCPVPLARRNCTLGFREPG